MKITDLKENQVVHCKTHEEAKRVLKLADEAGMKWIDEDSYIRKNYWYRHKEKTCYFLYKGTSGPVDFYEEEKCEIIPSEKIIDMENKTEFFEERVMEVSGDGINWYPRVVFGKKNGKYISWVEATTVEEAEEIIETFTWNYAREIDPFRELKEAYARGEVIQCYSEFGEEWLDTTDPRWCDHFKYRIKPKPKTKYVPFTFEDAELFMSRMIIAKDKSCKAIIDYSDDEGVLLHSVEKSYNYLLVNYTFIDGSPCGKEVEG